jgi:hypothetical protein
MNCSQSLQNFSYVKKSMFRIRVGLNTNPTPDLGPANDLNTVRIRIRIQEANSMRIYADTDPDQLCGHKKVEFIHILLSFK